LSIDIEDAHLTYRARARRSQPYGHPPQESSAGHQIGAFPIEQVSYVIEEELAH
jgi:hypothetical protein